MSNATDARTSWFAIITKPRTHLLATIAALTVFVTGVLLGTYLLSDHRLMLYIPSIGILLWWYVAMMSRYRKARSSH